MLYSYLLFDSIAFIYQIHIALINRIFSVVIPCSHIVSESCIKVRRDSAP